MSKQTEIPAIMLNGKWYVPQAALKSEREKVKELESRLKNYFKTRIGDALCAIEDKDYDKAVQILGEALKEKQ